MTGKKGKPGCPGFFDNLSRIVEKLRHSGEKSAGIQVICQSVSGDQDRCNKNKACHGIQAALFFHGHDFSLDGVQRHAGILWFRSSEAKKGVADEPISHQA
jgi:hypothetical protein